MAPKLNIATVLALSVALIATLAMVGYVSETEALPSLWKKLSCAKDYMIQMVKDKVVSKSTLVREYNQTMSAIQRRYEEAQQDGSLKGMDEPEKENFYYKITVEELNSLKERIQNGLVQERGLGSADAKLDEQELEADNCYNPDAMVENWSPDSADLDEDDESELWTELENLELQARQESEMGWSLSDEAKEALRSRTKTVLTDILNNEVRQIATAVISAYLSGGSLAPVLLALSGTLKFKLMEYLLNGVVDLMSSAMGRQIEIKPAPVEIAAGPAIPADPMVAPVVAPMVAPAVVAA